MRIFYALIIYIFSVYGVAYAVGEENIGNKGVGQENKKISVQEPAGVNNTAVPGGHVIDDVVVTFKDGDKVSGSILDRNDNEIIINVQGVNMTRPLSDVQEINLAGAKEFQNITIKGNVIFDEYKEGTIVIYVTKVKKLFDGSKVATKVLDAPGPYEIFIPKCAGQIWIKAYNSLEGTGKKQQQDPEFKYEKNPVIINGDSEIITGIDLKIKKLKGGP